MEMLTPECVAEQRGLAPVPQALFIHEASAQQRLHAQYIQEILRKAHSAQTARFAVIDESESRVIEECEIGAELLEGMVLRVPFEKIVHARCSGGQPARSDVFDPHQTPGLFKRQ